MRVTRLINILSPRHAVFFISGVIVSVTINFTSLEANPSNSSPHFDDQTTVVSKEDVYRFNQQRAQFEPVILSALRNRIDSAFLIASAKVRFDDRRPEQPIAEENRDSPVSGTSTRRAVTVTSTAPNRNENEPATPIQTTPVATLTVKPVHDRHHDRPPRSLWVFIIFVIAALILIWRTMGPRRSKEPPRHRDESYNPPIYPLRIAIKVKSADGKLPQELDGWQASLGDAAKRLAPLRLLPLFPSLDSTLLSELVARAKRNDSSYEPPDFSAWFQVETPAEVNASELVKPLRKIDNVETAYVMRPGPPPSGREEDPRNLEQGYQDPAPKGIDARYAWGFAGGDGAGIGFVDLEQGWNLNHADLKDANITIISGLNKESYPHGTEVLGGVLMVENTKGGKGIAPSATGRVISQWRCDGTSNIADAILYAAWKMSLGDVNGDVLLLEAQEYDQASETYYWPVEIVEANYLMIRLATALGIIVVEAAGNGGYDLNSYTDAAHKKILNRRSADFREDSGAIMVGAGSSEERRRLPFSNHGNRIDCYAWGENIATTTTNQAGTSNTRYTSNFGGTSGASSIVAGAALIVQGIAQAGLGHRLSPLELRDLLTRNGTTSNTPETDRIGVMPNLRAIITDNQSVLKPLPKSAASPP